jgi:uncharacterized coiled-coil protein SlyX
MRKSTGITSVESKAAFQEKLIEKFVQQNLPPKTPKPNQLSGMGNFSNRFKQIESCAAETPVIGTIEVFLTPTLFNAVLRVSIPVTSRFFVFCTRKDNDEYRVACSTSLS